MDVVLYTSFFPHKSLRMLWSIINNIKIRSVLLLLEDSNPNFVLGDTHNYYCKETENRDLAQQKSNSPNSERFLVRRLIYRAFAYFLQNINGIIINILV